MHGGRSALRGTGLRVVGVRQRSARPPTTFEQASPARGMLSQRAPASRPPCSLAPRNTSTGQAEQFHGWRLVTVLAGNRLGYQAEQL